jgi:serine/threonine protein kinase
LDTGELPDGKPYIVMQYVDGFTLRSIMQPEGADLDRVANLMEQVGHALNAAHEEGVFHRDLKPENIMVQVLAGNREQIKIIDFGIAKVRDSQVAPSTFVGATAGTIAYMSPEQLRAEKVTAPSDVYALGVIAYELVTGRRPFNPETLFQLLEMQREGVRVKPKDLRPSLPEPAQAVILKALAFERKDRYQSAAEFGEDFEKAIEQGVETPRGYVDRDAPTKLIEAQSEFPPKHRLRPWVIAAISLLFLSIVAVGAWWVLKSRSGVTTQPASSSHSIAVSELTLSYWLTVQKMRESKPYQDSFESSGQEIFENGWKFRLNASSQQEGNLYLLNEGPDGKGGTSYNILYPAPSPNNGSAKLYANQQMQTGWYVFDENQGTEKFWIIWSSQPVLELEAVKGVINPLDKGTIKDAAQAAAVREFLTKNILPNPTIEKDSARKRTNLKAKGDLMVSVVELEHH